jgi:DNA polymerase I-like protein with 3'-5' exonuclease and polymerase domains
LHFLILGFAANPFLEVIHRKIGSGEILAERRRISILVIPFPGHKFIISYYFQIEFRVVAEITQG